MRKWLLALALPVVALLAVSCNQTGSAVTSPYTESKQEPVKQNESEKEPAKAEKSTELPPIQTEIPKPPEKPTPKKVDPAILGEYRLVLDPEQMKQIDQAIEQMKQNVASDPKAGPALEMALKAREMAKNMKVKLENNARYIADFGQGQSNGSYTPTPDGVLLKPDRQTGDPADPTDMELVFNKKDRTLTASFKGENMIFKRM